ncbi:MAG: ribonuclease D [Alphaproteobacteria bacterium]|jgi:ribonuclease D|nr:ribonuclease D [Rhodospirillaceae bacterium]MDP6255188.1 ribonuclease D [Alphaproteobacteria bacterium]MDP7052608.1 ribonuclease D [Alphaproteobacteria bacterium]MDP7229725.1 ribonuclease D [Alphaproteobacteria bacterium]HJM92924.1 ribonuclease D [Alphaproteobacteria bacterium]|tara:strand:- start:4570 stop:5739 length:1170 start_codon:yes stop_codon:yes gene_type:complete
MSPQRITELIDDSETLAVFCSQLSASPYITIDTEFIRDRTYWPRLCLVQLANHDIARAIDPLAEGIDLSPLADFLADQNVIKVFHAARQDVEIFVQQNDVVPSPMFDTQIAAMVCGFGDSVGYDRLVEKLAGARIDKGSRFTDWSRRPLSDKQIGYALDDVTHLLSVYEALCRQLEESDRAHWLAEEMAVLTNMATYIQSPEDVWRRLKIRSRNPQYLGVAKEIAAWREREAQRRNMPRGHILKDEAIQEIAAEMPERIETLSRLRAVSKGLAEGPAGEELLAAVQRGRNLPNDEVPKPSAQVILPRGLGPLVDLLKVLLKTKCETNDVAQKLVATVSDLEHIAADDKADVAALRGWRREIFGNDALDLKHGRLAMTAKGKRVELIHTP